MRKFFEGWIFIVLLLTTFFFAFAEKKEMKTLPFVQTKTPPEIDGVLMEPLWQSAPKATGFEDALLRIAADDQTVVYLLYDEKNIYVGFYCYDSKPQKIVARVKKDNAPLHSDDYVGFSIDTFHSHKFYDRSFFLVNPIGTKYARLGGGRAQKIEWQGKWKAAAQIVRNGWTAEMAIPWEILTYPETNKSTTIGINFERMQQHTSVHSWWSNVGQQEFLEDDGHWVGVFFPSKRREYSLLPYFYAGMEEKSKGKWDVQGGIDARYPFSSSLTFVGTIHPDFTNIEQEVESIDFSYGERFVPDRRPFFQEGSSFYSSGNIAGRFIYTPRIPKVDVGINLYGKLKKKTTVGILETLKWKERNDFILRGRQDFSATSGVDVTLIDHRTEEDSNQVLVLGEHYRFKQLYIEPSFAQSFVDGERKGATANIISTFHGKQWTFTAVPFFIAPSFQDKLGFFPFTDYRGMALFFTYRTQWQNFFLKNGSFFARSGFSNRYNGELFQRVVALGGQVKTVSDYKLSLGWDGGRFLENRDSVFDIGIKARASDQFTNFGVRCSLGQRGGGSVRFLNPFLNMQLRNFTVGLQSQLLWHQTNRQQHVLTLNYDFSPKLGLAGRMIIRDGKTNFYLAFRRSGYAGIEIFLILGKPNDETFQERFVFKGIVPF